MSLLKSMFAETADHGVHKKHLKRISKSCKHLGGVENTIPILKYPAYNSKNFKEDLAEVERCYRSKSLNTSFLHSSDDSVSDIFKKFMSEEAKDHVDWNKIESLLREVDAIVLRLKYKYKRLRPKEYLTEKSPLYEEIKDSKSFSFPSGHTAMAYFLSGVLGKISPDISSDLRMLSELIGQSRIENGVHYPSDVSYGRYIGEMLSSYYNDNSIRDSLTGIKTSTTKNKKIADFFREKAKECRPSLSEDKALSLYTDDLARYIYRTNELSGIQVNHKDCIAGARNFLSGYPANYCSRNKNVQSILTGLSLCKICKKFNSVSSVVALHKGLGVESIRKGMPAELRSNNDSRISGVAYSDPEDIFAYLKKSLKLNDPIVKHVLITWVNPFQDGSGRIARLILAKDLGYNLDIINQILDENYNSLIDRFLSSAKVTDYLK